MEKYAFVTGTDHGVGLSLVSELLKRGYTVVAARLNPTENQIDKLKESYNNLYVITCDVGSDESVKSMRAQVLDLIPSLDLIINNAGILGDMTKEIDDEIDFEEITRVINVNSLGPLRVTNALYELLLKGKEKTVVNISSEAGSIGTCFRTGWFGYCMSKAANNMQSALVHNKLIKAGGRVIAMHPGHVATWMRGHLDTTGKISPDQSAEGILKVVLDSDIKVEEHPIYIDFKGNRLPW